MGRVPKKAVILRHLFALAAIDEKHQHGEQMLEAFRCILAFVEALENQAEVVDSRQAEKRGVFHALFSLQIVGQFVELDGFIQQFL